MGAGAAISTLIIGGAGVFALYTLTKQQAGSRGLPAPTQASFDPAAAGSRPSFHDQVTGYANGLFSSILNGEYSNAFSAPASSISFSSGGPGRASTPDVNSDRLPTKSVPTPTRPTARPNTGPLLRLIGSVEAPRGYNQVYGGSVIFPPNPITSMTIAQVLAWQDKSVRAGSKSSAAGQYQIIRKTLRGLVSGGAASMSDRFDKTTQDRLAHVLLERRGLSKFKAGKLSENAFANNIAKEWASMPVVTGSKTGRSYYAGDGLNKSLVSPSQVLSAVRAV